MSYYFCIVGTRDNPIYQADLASKPTTSSGPASFFSSNSSMANATSTASSSSMASSGPGASSGDQRGSMESSQSSQSATISSGGVFGFGNALGALAGGLGAAREARNTYGGSGQGQASTTTGEGKGLGFGRYTDRDVLQMIAHSSLDVVEDKQFVNQAMYLKAIDRINEWTTSAFITPGNLKFLILHEHKHDDGIRNFFFDVWELVVKIMMNPFHSLNDPILSTSFDSKVKASARKHL
ncbi:hypothetical protein CBS101457_001212 [Exobasidium rhododendri]|nr:hypothetical protein CBS101457_001212 [Exobasidium rhododendri]